MTIWLIAGTCYLLALGIAQTVLSSATRERYRHAVIFAEIATTAAMMLLITAWRRWNLFNVLSGKVAYDIDTVPPLAIVFVLSASAFAVAFALERK